MICEKLGRPTRKLIFKGTSWFASPFDEVIRNA